VKKTIAAGALVLSLLVVGCSNDKATPAPATEAPAAATEAPAAATEAPAAATEAPAEESPAA
jgi:PBP1b-binding outer membrane lipoprotein LpoB